VKGSFNVEHVCAAAAFRSLSFRGSVMIDHPD
jgi:hypothetical protein